MESLAFFQAHAVLIVRIADTYEFKTYGVTNKEKKSNFATLLVCVKFLSTSEQFCCLTGPQRPLVIRCN